MKSEHPLLSRDCLMICYASGAPATTPQCRRASLHSAFDPTARCSSNRPERSRNWHEITGTKAEFERQEPRSAAAFCCCILLLRGAGAPDALQPLEYWRNKSSRGRDSRI
jgi:hypothetical protein